MLPICASARTLHRFCVRKGIADFSCKRIRFLNGRFGDSQTPFACDGVRLNYCYYGTVKQQELRLASMYMHHIYNDKKKRFIKKRARQLQLTGLYLFGKPGRILLEGDASAVDDFLHDVKRLPWQICQVQDKWPIPERYFESFEECPSDREFRVIMEQQGLHEVLDGLRMF
eukprot:gnl/MRDRNA2_/MRDRNA2_17741_c0_seq1.p1 gnl/MRDRNA2_/MRDRNA2_17741_c0~~gnl/MRDRNA2_/MRDRNA2_17741_c0_seq1.p1  ORF type:complete len:171 (-),score=24.95 gnl/MRDRNA2_/MRDRNA2_17741_c0_seq1:64-576(-)